MILLRLAFKSIKNRLFTTSLTVFSIALSICLLLSVERTKQAAQDGFTQSVSQTDLLVGGRTGPLNLILYTVFNMGSATNNISMESYQHFKSHPAVAWTIPYSLGDGHRGFRIVATDENFYDHYHYRGDGKIEFISGKPALGIWDAVIGAEVERKLKYKLNDKIIIAHGVTRTEGIIKHSDKPFTVSGILKPTGTAIDQSIYISLYGMEAIHMDWKNGAAPTKDQETPQDRITKESIKLGPITSFFIRTKSRIETLGLQREINDYQEEPLLAIIPGATLADLWRGLSQIDNILKIISWMVIVVGMASMLSSLLAGLNERRREMAILRALGAGPLKITLLLVFESTVLTVLGIIVGSTVHFMGFSLLSNWLESKFGFYIIGSLLSSTEIWYIGITLIFGVLTGLIPAMKASQNALKDGLIVKS
ncbi:MAG: ABC transporter permease [Bdellovibrionales bacterium]|nr:ABC transporter permease [Bdellovibrionales bacterium]